MRSVVHFKDKLYIESSKELSAKCIRAINAKQRLQDTYVAEMREKMKKMVWQNTTRTGSYGKNMTEEVTSLSPELVTGFIFSRKWSDLSDYDLIK